MAKPANKPRTHPSSLFGQEPQEAYPLGVQVSPTIDFRIEKVTHQQHNDTAADPCYGQLVRADTEQSLGDELTPARKVT